MIHLQPPAGGPARALTEDLDLWPQSPVRAPASSALYFTGDRAANSPGAYDDSGADHTAAPQPA